MVEKNLKELLKIADERVTENNERYGQALFNALQELDSVTASKVRGTYADPFYDSAKVPRFLDSLFRYHDYAWDWES
jgi:hypothetical protein